MNSNKYLRSCVAALLMLFTVDGMTKNPSADNLFSGKSDLQIKEYFVNALICKQFRNEIELYELDKSKKEFKEFNIYFPEWPHQFKKLVSSPFYPVYKREVSQLLSLNKIYDLSPDFNDWAPPSLSALPCSADIERWSNLKEEWKKLKPILPENFLYNPSDFSIFLQELPEKIEGIFYSTVFYLLLLYAIFANGRLINDLIFKRKLHGIWSFALTPLLSIYFQKHLIILNSIKFSKIEKIILASCIIFILTLAFILTIKALANYFRRYDSTEINTKKVTREGLDIFQAVTICDKHRVRELIEAEPKLIESRNSNGWTPLHVTAAQGIDTRQEHVEIADLLLQNGADPDSRSPLGWTPLHLIAINGADESLPILQLLILYKANPTLTTDDGVTNWLLLWQHGAKIKDAIENYEKQWLHGK